MIDENTPEDVQSNIENPAAAVEDDKDEYDHIVDDTLSELSDSDEDEEDDDESSAESSSDDKPSEGQAPRNKLSKQNRRKQKSKARYDEMVWKSRDSEERASRFEHENSELRNRTIALERDNAELKRNFEELTHMQEQLLTAAANPDSAQAFMNTWTQPKKTSERTLTAAEVEELATRKADERYEQRLRKEKQDQVTAESIELWKKQIARVHKEHARPELIDSMMDSFANEKNEAIRNKNGPLLRSAAKYKYGAEALYAASNVPGFRQMSSVDQGAMLVEMHEKISRRKTAVTKSEPTSTARSSGGGKSVREENLTPEQAYARKYKINR